MLYVVLDVVQQQGMLVWYCTLVWTGFLTNQSIRFLIYQVNRKWHAAWLVLTATVGTLFR